MKSVSVLNGPTRVEHAFGIHTPGRKAFGTFDIKREIACVTHINIWAGTVWYRMKAAILDRPAFKVQSPLHRV